LVRLMDSLLGLGLPSVKLNRFLGLRFLDGFLDPVLDDAFVASVGFVQALVLVVVLLQLAKPLLELLIRLSFCALSLEILHIAYYSVVVELKDLVLVRR
jgi:hypothetical protein